MSNNRPLHRNMINYGKHAWNIYKDENRPFAIRLKYQLACSLVTLLCACKSSEAPTEAAAIAALLKEGKYAAFIDTDLAKLLPSDFWHMVFSVRMHVLDLYRPEGSRKMPIVDSDFIGDICQDKH